MIATEEGDDDYDYDSLITEYEDLLEELRFINSMLGFPVENEPQQIVESRENLLRKIRDIRDRLGLYDSFDTTMGYDPLKVFRLGLFGVDDWMK